MKISKQPPKLKGNKQIIKQFNWHRGWEIPPNIPSHHGSLSKLLLKHNKLQKNKFNGAFLQLSTGGITQKKKQKKTFLVWQLSLPNKLDSVWKSSSASTISDGNFASEVKPCDGKEPQLYLPHCRIGTSLAVNVSQTSLVNACGSQKSLEAKYCKCKYCKVPLM